MENIQYSFTDSLSVDKFSFGQMSGSANAQDDMTTASKFNPTYVVLRHHSAFQQAFPPHHTWEEPVVLPGETACNVRLADNMYLVNFDLHDSAILSPSPSAKGNLDLIWTATWSHVCILNSPSPISGSLSIKKSSMFFPPGCVHFVSRDCSLMCRIYGTPRVQGLWRWSRGVWGSHGLTMGDKTMCCHWCCAYATQTIPDELWWSRVVESKVPSKNNLVWLGVQTDS